MKDRTIVEGTWLFSFLQIAEKLYGGNISLIGGPNGCPIGWKLIFMLAFLIPYTLLIAPFVLLMQKILDAFESADWKVNKQFLVGYVYLILGCIWIAVGWTTTIYLIDLVFPFKQDAYKAFNFVSWLVAVIFFALPIACYLLVWTVFTIGYICFSTADKCKELYANRNEASKAAYEAKIAEDPEYSTSWQIFKGFFSDLYANHCPKITWVYKEDLENQAEADNVSDNEGSKQQRID